MAMTWIALFAGLAMLFAGGEVLVRGAVAIARRLGVSPLLIGLTLVGFGTSTPELVTSLEAAAAGAPGIAVGNVVGSNTANLLLILGLAAMLRPMIISPAALKRDGLVMAAAAVIGAVLVVADALDRWQGAALIAILVGYVVLTFLRERSGQGPSAELHAAEGDAVHAVPQRIRVSLPLFLAGLALTIFGAQLLVGASIDLARTLGIPESVIGLTIVAVGTSLPELTITVIAALRGQGDVAFGNVIGSNIYNILGILGLTAVLTPVDVPPAIGGFDIWVMLAATLAALFFAFTRLRVSRLEGGALLLAYAAYLAVLVFRQAAVAST
jgi:cation:H+ antiporter